MPVQLETAIDFNNFWFDEYWFNPLRVDSSLQLGNRNTECNDKRNCLSQIKKNKFVHKARSEPLTVNMETAYWSLGNDTVWFSKMYKRVEGMVELLLSSRRRQ